jgi:hypothetical protein
MRVISKPPIWPILTAALCLGACVAEINAPEEEFIASQWRWQYPVPTGNDLHDVWGFADGQLFVVGEVGTILHDDGSWALEPMDVPTTEDLHAVWGASPDDVFAVGRCGMIVHYNGEYWEIVQGPTDETLHDIWGTSSDAIFAVGDNGTFLRYDGSHWAVTPTHTHLTLKSVWASAPDDVYLIEGYQTILHFGGAGFSIVDTDSAEYNGLNSVWGRSESEVYVAGSSGVVLTYNGIEWTDDRIGGYDDLADIWVTGDTIIFTVGDGHLGVSYPDGSKHYGYDTANNNKGYRAVWSPGDTTAYAVGDNGMISRFDTQPPWERYGYDAGINRDFWGVWGSGPDNVYAIGNGIHYYNGTSWHGNWLISSNFRDVWGFGSSYIFIVGAEGRFMTATGPGPSEHKSWRFHDHIGLWGVWGTSPNDIYIVGERGKIVSGRVGNWATPASDNEHTLLDVHGSTRTNPEWKPEPFVVAVGAEGTILHAGEPWTRQPSGTAQPLYGVWVYSERSAFAVGESGTILTFNGAEWQKAGSGTTKWLSCVWGTTPIDVWAGGEGGTLLHFDGAAWTSVKPITKQVIRGIWGSASGDVFAVGGNNMVLHYGD